MATIREFFRVLAVCHTVVPDGEPLPHSYFAYVKKAFTWAQACFEVESEAFQMPALLLFGHASCL